MASPCVRPYAAATAPAAPKAVQEREPGCRGSVGDIAAALAWSGERSRQDLTEGLVECGCPGDLAGETTRCPVVVGVLQHQPDCVTQGRDVGGSETLDSTRRAVGNREHQAGAGLGNELGIGCLVGKERTYDERQAGRQCPERRPDPPWQTTSRA